MADTCTRPHSPRVGGGLAWAGASGGRGLRWAGPEGGYITNLCKRLGSGSGGGGGAGAGPGCTGPGKMAAMEAEAALMTLESLPTDPLLLILSFLDYRDLIK